METLAHSQGTAYPHERAPMTEEELSEAWGASPASLVTILAARIAALEAELDRLDHQNCGCVSVARDPSTGLLTL
jgi:hypothetical protein